MIVIVGFHEEVPVTQKFVQEIGERIHLKVPVQMARRLSHLCQKEHVGHHFTFGAKPTLREGSGRSDFCFLLLEGLMTCANVSALHVVFASFSSWAS